MKNKLNLPPFYIGQKVVYVGKNKKPNNNKFHIVTELKKQTCGCYDIVVDYMGLEYEQTFSPNEFYRCPSCGKSHKWDGFFGWNPKSFRPLEEINPPLLTFTQIKETEKEEILIMN